MKKAIILFLLIGLTIPNVFAMTYDQASQQEKPIIVMFKMKKCSACRKFSPKFDKFAEKFSKKFNFIKEDVDSSKIASVCKSDTVPAFYVMHPKTQKAERISDSCVWDKQCFTEFLNNYK